MLAKLGYCTCQLGNPRGMGPLQVTWHVMCHDGWLVWIFLNDGQQKKKLIASKKWGHFGRKYPRSIRKHYFLPPFYYFYVAFATKTLKAVKKVFNVVENTGFVMVKTIKNSQKRVEITREFLKKKKISWYSSRTNCIKKMIYES